MVGIKGHVNVSFPADTDDVTALEEFGEEGGERRRRRGVGRGGGGIGGCM